MNLPSVRSFLALCTAILYVRANNTGTHDGVFDLTAPTSVTPGQSITLSWACAAGYAEPLSAAVKGPTWSGWLAISTDIHPQAGATTFSMPSALSGSPYTFALLSSVSGEAVAQSAPVTVYASSEKATAADEDKGKHKGYGSGSGSDSGSDTQQEAGKAHADPPAAIPATGPTPTATSPAYDPTTVSATHTHAQDHPRPSNTAAYPAPTKQHAHSASLATSAALHLQHHSASTSGMSVTRFSSMQSASSAITGTEVSTSTVAASTFRASSAAPGGIPGSGFAMVVAFSIVLIQGLW
ncbi:hypothetical protein MKEN_01301200 [Mycena kentingensis (nom. inval.)]|nr:hypothetical protein MKEN_01301200 [Mycena kentingensis (nom. inval.)]